MQVNRGADRNRLGALEEVLSSARTLSSESTPRLREELDRFMANIRAA